jgi:hypothetical protein
MNKFMEFLVARILIGTYNQNGNLTDPLQPQFCDQCMKYSVRLFASAIIVSLITTATSCVDAAPTAVDVVIQKISGSVEFCNATGTWQPLRPDSLLISGSVIRTHDESAVDLQLKQSKTTLRLKADSKLVFETLETWSAGEEYVTDTQLRLVNGSLVGSQKKLPRASHFKIVTAEKIFSITGTDYVITAPGLVTVLEGAVSVSNVADPSAESSHVISAGTFLNASTGAVVPISRDVLAGVTSDHNAVQNNAGSFKLTAATTVDLSSRFVSPVHGGDNGVGNGNDPAPPGNPPSNDGPGTGRGNPGNRGGGPRP